MFLASFIHALEKLFLALKLKHRCFGLLHIEAPLERNTLLKTRITNDSLRPLTALKSILQQFQLFLLLNCHILCGERWPSIRHWFEALHIGVMPCCTVPQHYVISQFLSICWSCSSGRPGMLFSAASWPGKTVQKREVEITTHISAEEDFPCLLHLVLQTKVVIHNPLPLNC